MKDKQFNTGIGGCTVGKNHNVGIGSEARFKTSHNICIGPYAGYELTTESNLFCIVICGKEFRTKITDAEYDVVSSVFNRAIEAGAITSITPIGDKSLNDQNPPTIGNTGLGGKILREPTEKPNDRIRSCLIGYECRYHKPQHKRH